MSSLDSLSITIFITFLLLLPSSEGVDNRYKTCASASFSCGDYLTNVRYPFWGDGRPQYCGHPALELQCFNSTETGISPILRIGRQENRDIYNILNVRYSSDNITLQLQVFDITMSGDIPCTSNTTELRNVFQFSPSVELSTFYYNCSSASVDVVNIPEITTVPCFTPSNNYTAYNGPYLQLYGVTPSDNAQSFYLNSICNSTQLPMIRANLDVLSSDNTISDIIGRGFEVKYEYSSECLRCTKFNGICGSSNDSDFVCFHNEASGNLPSNQFTGSSKSKTLVIVVGSASSIMGVGMLIVIITCIRKRRMPLKFAAFWKLEAAKSPNVDAFLQIYGSFAITRYTHANIKKMTNDFKEKLGEGGYAIVYKGKLLSGRLVAVKVLKQSKGDGEDFLNEVASIGRTNHVNIVTLLGICFEGNKRALIYEFLPNGSLEKFTYLGAANQSLPWETVFNIAVGIARGLDYLHRGCKARILHFDIKPHNILLDQEFCPKISDFGLARLCPLQESTISMWEARGTIGYIAPEVFCRTIGGVSHKSDVYSFGMMVIDMVCGRKNLSDDMKRSSEQYFPQWIHDRLEAVEEEEEGFHGVTNDEEKAVQRKMIFVSLWCIQTYPSNRPSMSKVVEMLLGSLESFELPPKPNLSSPPRLALDNSATLTVITATSD